MRLHDGQATLWEQMLPDEIQLMGPELEAIDSLLDDPRFLAPFVERFFCPIGRPTIPMECYLRLMLGVMLCTGPGVIEVTRSSATQYPTWMWS